MKRLCFYISMCFVQISAMALNSIEIANSRYQAFIEVKKGKKMLSEKANQTITPIWQNEASSLFAFPNVDNKGIVLISGVPGSKPVLGYTDSGVFDVNAIPDGLKAMLNVYTAELKTLSANEGGEYVQIVTEPVLPLLGTIAWDQGEPYNLMCPIYMGNTRSATGCVATAMAQIMYYYKYPEVGTGSHSYTPELYPAMGELSVDYSQSYYDWDNMQSRYVGEESETAKMAVAKLMYDCGVAVNMQYGSQSGANSPDWPAALTSYFSYDKGVSLRTRAYYTAAEWDAAIQEELYAGRPVYVTGFTENSGGHAFVFDGCDSQGLYHVNWGWSGMSNGYFASTALTPSAQGVGGSVGGFNYKQIIITGIAPMQENSFIVPELVSEEALTAPATADKSELVAVKLNGRVKNVGWIDVTVEFAIVVTDSEGKQVAISEVSESKQVEVGSDCRKISFEPMDFSELNDGTYTLRPVCRTAENAPWTPVRDIDLAYPNKMYLIVEGDKLTFRNFEQSLLKGEIVQLPTKIVAGQTTCATLRITNEGESEYYGSLRGVLLDKETRKRVATSSETIVNIPAGTTQDIQLLMPFETALSAGNYIIEVEDYIFNQITGGKEVYIDEFVVDAEIKSVSVPVIENAENVDPLAIKATAKLRCDVGFFSDQLLLYFFAPGSDVALGCIGPVFACIDTGCEVEVEIVGSFENAEPDTDYEAVLVDGRYVSYVTPRDMAKTVFHTQPALSVDEIDVEEGEKQYYNISGLKVDNPIIPGIYIVVYSTGKTEKLIIK